jgi:hypothetical protein
MDPDSILGKRAKAVGLNPLMASRFQICCLENGIDPDKSSLVDLAITKWKLPSNSSQAYIEEKIGARWVTIVCK